MLLVSGQLQNTVMPTNFTKTGITNLSNPLIRRFQWHGVSAPPFMFDAVTGAFIILRPETLTAYRNGDPVSYWINESNRGWSGSNASKENNFYNIDTRNDGITPTLLSNAKNGYPGLSFSPNGTGSVLGFRNYNRLWTQSISKDASNYIIFIDLAAAQNGSLVVNGINPAHWVHADNPGVYQDGNNAVTFSIVPNQTRYFLRKIIDNGNSSPMISVDLNSGETINHTYPNTVYSQGTTYIPFGSNARYVIIEAIFFDRLLTLSESEEILEYFRKKYRF